MDTKRMTLSRLLRKGDVLVCKRDGQTERVTMVNRSGGGRVGVRTTRHDHMLEQDQTVEVLR